METSISIRSTFSVEEGQFDDFESSPDHAGTRSGSRIDSCSSGDSESEDWEEEDEEWDWEDEKGSLISKGSLVSSE